MNLPARLPPRRRLAASLALSLGLLLVAGCAASPGLTATQRDEVFRAAWTRIGELHFDPQLGGVDWPAVRDRYAPIVAVAADDAQFRSVLMAMVGELRHSHVAVLPPLPKANGAAGTAAAAGDRTGTLGLGVDLLGDELVVVRVEAGAAADAGIATGDRIDRLDGRTLAALLAPHRAHGGEHWRRDAILALRQELAGPVGSSLELMVGPADAAPRRVALVRRAAAAPPLDLGTLGTLPSEFAASELDGGVLYVRFSPCFQPQQERFVAALAAHPQATGLVLDLRGNPGGLGAVAMGVARHLLREPTDLGTMRMRDAKEPLRFAVLPAPEPFAGPLVILVDGTTGSTAEILAAGLQKLGRARIVGTTSAGAALPSVLETLPHGWRLQAVVADFTLPDGTSVEGHGVVPDVVVEPAAADYARGEDPVVKAGLAELARAPKLAAAVAATPTTAPSKPTGARADCAMDAATRALWERLCADPTQRRLATARSVRLTTAVTVMGLRGQSVTTVAGDQAHVVTQLPSVGETLQVVAGNRAWSRDPFTGSRELSGAELAQTRRAVQLAAHSWPQAFAKLAIVAQERLGDRDCAVLEQTPPAGEGDAQQLWIDLATLDVVRLVSTAESPLGKIRTTSEYTEYADFGGLRLAKTTTAKAGGSTFTTTLEKVELDVEVAPELFTIPPR